MPQALVTGANRGIGLELTRQLLESGYSVHATYRKTEGGLTELVQPLLHLHQLDVRSDEAIAAVASVFDGGLDLLINNAGIADGRWASVEDIDFEVVSEVMEVNAIAPVRVTRGLLPALERAGGGTVVMMTSLMASIADLEIMPIMAIVNRVGSSVENKKSTDAITISFVSPVAAYM